MSFVSLISDEPCVEVNHLPERQRLIEQIADAVAYSRPPLVVGVHGDWGSGKTSFLHALQWHLTGRCDQNPEKPRTPPPKKPHYPHVTAIWFEAWRYQHETAPLIALLHEIRKQLTFTAHPGKRLMKVIEKNGLIAVDGALRTFDQTVGILAAHFGGLPVDPAKVKISPIENLRAAGEAREVETLATQLPGNTLREQLRKAIANILPGEAGKDPTKNPLEPRLVVFIDDLDRCEAEATLRLLEGLKVYLNLSNCVFVLGLNQREVERALARVMPSGKKDGAGAADAAELTARAQEYLAKFAVMSGICRRRGSRKRESCLKTGLPGGFLKIS